jgi:hypothetical protein
MENILYPVINYERHKSILVHGVVVLRSIAMTGFCALQGIKLLIKRSVENL